MLLSAAIVHGSGHCRQDGAQAQVALFKIGDRQHDLLVGSLVAHIAQLLCQLSQLIGVGGIVIDHVLHQGDQLFLGGMLAAAAAGCAGGSIAVMGVVVIAMVMIMVMVVAVVLMGVVMVMGMGMGMTVMGVFVIVMMVMLMGMSMVVMMVVIQMHHSFLSFLVPCRVCFLAAGKI